MRLMPAPRESRSGASDCSLLASAISATLVDFVDMCSHLTLQPGARVRLELPITRCSGNATRQLRPAHPDEVLISFRLPLKTQEPLPARCVAGTQTIPVIQVT